MKAQTALLTVIALLGTSLLGTQSAVAQQDLIPFKRAATRAESFELSEKNGPWLIKCYSFSGEGGQQQAQRLANELRQSYKLKAYTYTHRFDISDKIQANTVATKKYVRDHNGKEVIGRDGKPMLVDKKLKPASDSNIVETAVLVGDYGSVEDENAQHMLAQIKRITPKSLRGGTLGSVNQAHSTQGNMLRNAFMLPNPMLPEEYFAARSVDEFVIGINRKVRRYGLLDCPGKYSVRIATFRGKTVINSAKIQEQMADFKWRLKNRQSINGELAECANKANMLTKALRAEGIEAWEFHDREESYVCVGSFDWLKKVNASGAEVQNPEIREAILKYRGEVQKNGSHTYVKSVSVPKSIRDKQITYDIQPLPVLVPKAPEVKRAGLFSKWR